MANEFIARKGLIVSSSAFVTGSLRVTTHVSASAFSGSGANITGVISSSFASTASAATSITFTPTTASFATTASLAQAVQFTNILNRPTLVSASSQISYTGLSNTPNGILSSSTQINALSGVSASFATTSSAATSITFTPSSASFATTASFAVSASWAPGGSTGNTFPFTGSADISGSLSINTNGTKALFSTLKVQGSDGFNLWIGNGGQNITAGASFQTSYNTSVGYDALAKNTTGYSNTAIGYSALYSSSIGNYNTAVGADSLFYNESGTENTAVGSATLFNNTTGINNTAVGSDSLFTNTTGIGNLAIGNDAGYYIDSGSYNTIIGSFDGNQNGLDIRNANNYIVLSDGQGNPRIVTNNTGNVGIGNVAPVNKLQVQGNVSASSYTSSLNNAVGYFGTASFAVSASWAPGGGTSATSSYALVAEAVRILSGSPDPLQSQYTGSFTGSFIGNTVVSGSLTATGIISAAEFNTTSDINKKDNVVLIQDALSLVNNMRGVTFTWKDTQQPSAGVIAQDIQQILPELVHTKSDGYLSVNYDGLIGVLIEAIKQLQQEVEELKRDAI